MKNLRLLSAGVFTLACSAFSAAPASTAGAPAGKLADKNPGFLKMSLINMKCLYSSGADAESNKANVQANLQRHIYFIDKVAAEGAEFVGFPEMSLSGYSFSNSMLWLSLTGPEVKALQQKAIEKGVYVSAGLAELDAGGKKWNTQIVIDPKGQIVGWHHKIWLTSEKGFTSAGTTHNVFEVKGVKMGISICADGTDRKNLQALVDNGAKIIYGPHCNNNKGTVTSWYDFRAPWGGANGWIAQMKVHAALHNHAASYAPEFAPPGGKGSPARFSGGSWFIGPDGQTLAQMPPSSPSKEFILTHNVPISGR